VHSALKAAGLALSPAERQRVTAFAADLALPDLGLRQEELAELGSTCDAIVHNGAAVGVVRDYATLRPANTESTRCLLRLAAPRSIPVHYVSTLSVGPPRALRDEFPEAFLEAHEGLRYGYQQSKWASERLLEQAAERGLPVTVHRLGRVVGPVATGAVNSQDFLWTVLRAGVPAGIVPDLFTEESWTPVDRVAAEIVAVGPGAHHRTAVVHHHAGAPVRQEDLHRWLREYGYPVEDLPLGTWRERIPRDSADAAAVLAFFDSLPTRPDRPDEDLGLATVRADNVRESLASAAGALPPEHPAIDRAAFFRQLDRCVATGALPPVPTPSTASADSPQHPGTRSVHRPTPDTNPGQRPASC
jgi:nonribosomal peptide synthetase MxcG